MGKVKAKKKSSEATSFVVVEYDNLVSYCTKADAGDLPILFETDSEEEAVAVQRKKAEELEKDFQY